MAAATEAPTRLKPSEIEVVKDFNPRTTMDQQKLDELAASIKQHGLIQPLVVGEKNEKGKYPLVAGHRRLAALKKNKATTVDVKVLSVNGNAKALAVTENLQREQVNPIDEANGFAQVMEAEKLNQKQLASRLGISTSQVSDRLRLLKLPQAAQDAIAEGKVPTSTASFIDRIASISVDVAVVVTVVLAASEDAHQESKRQSHNFISEVKKGCKTAGVLLAEVDTYSIADTLRPLSADTEARKEIAKGLLAGADDYSVSYYDRPSWRDSDTDAARKFKVLIEFGNHNKFVVDPDFVWDRLALINTKYQKAAEKTAKRSDSGEDAASRQKTERAAKREKDRIARLKAQEHNEQLGERLRAKTESMPVTLERMKTIVLTVLSIPSQYGGPAAGLVLTTPEFHDKHIKTFKDGREQLKVEPIPVSSARENVQREVFEATSVEQVMGIFYRAMFSTLYGDLGALPSNLEFKFNWTVPGTGRFSDNDLSPNLRFMQEAVELGIVVDEQADRLRDQLKAAAIEVDPEDLEDGFVQETGETIDDPAGDAADPAAEHEDPETAALSEDLAGAEA